MVGGSGNSNQNKRGLFARRDVSTLCPPQTAVHPTAEKSKDPKIKWQVQIPSTVGCKLLQPKLARQPHHMVCIPLGGHKETCEGKGVPEHAMYKLHKNQGKGPVTPMMQDESPPP